MKKFTLITLLVVLLFVTSVSATCGNGICEYGTDNVKISLHGGDQTKTITLSEGEEKTINLEGTEFIIKNIVIMDIPCYSGGDYLATFIVNNKTTKKLGYHGFERLDRLLGNNNLYDYYLLVDPSNQNSANVMIIGPVDPSDSEAGTDYVSANLNTGDSTEVSLAGYNFNITLKNIESYDNGCTNFKINEFTTEKLGFNGGFMIYELYGWPSYNSIDFTVDEINLDPNGETDINCPEDCAENLKPDECSSNYDCDDNDESTDDICTGFPKKCIHNKIIVCIDNDGYCPIQCEYEDDNDCEEPDECSIIRITTNTHDQHSPKIYGNYVVYFDQRKKQGFNEVYAYNLISKKEFFIDGSERQFIGLDFNNNKIIYGKYNLGGDHNGEEAVFLYDLNSNSKKTIIDNGRWISGRDISGNYIVYSTLRETTNVNEETSVYLYDIGNGKTNEIYKAEGDNINPSVSDKYVTWIHWKTNPSDGDSYVMPNSELLLYNIQTGEIKKIADIDLNFWKYKEEGPKVDNTRVIWIDGNDKNNDIYEYKISTGTKTKLTNSNSPKEHLTLSGNYISWADWRNENNGKYYLGEGNSDIYLFDISKNKEFRITSDTSYESSPLIYNGRIVFNSNKNGNLDIYLYELQCLDKGVIPKIPEENNCETGDGICSDGCNYNNDKDCPEPDQCSIDSDCDDNNDSTKDVCSGSPKKCSNTKITECVTGDNYCPPNCKYENDKDCPELDQCSIDSDCDDNNACTIDKCSGTPKKCFNQRNSGGCDLNGNCVPVGTKTKSNYCSLNNSFKDQKPKESSCNNNYECSSNICIDNNCIEPGFIQKIINWFKKLFGG